MPLAWVCGAVTNAKITARPMAQQWTVDKPSDIGASLQRNLNVRNGSKTGAAGFGGTSIWFITSGVLPQENWDSFLCQAADKGKRDVIVNAELGTDTRRSSGMSRLNDSERAVLRLLAEGHTAKSIATTIGSTTAAVNERLREARRKTGVGSSRELARLLKAQEICDEQIEVFLPPAAAASSPQPTWATVFKRKGAIAVTIIAGLAAMAALLVAQPDTTEPATQTVTDPDLGTFTLAGPSWLYKALRQEPRDEAWAPTAEKVLRSRYEDVRFFGEKPRILRITCRAMTCEVAASFPPALNGPSYGEEEATIRSDMRKQGLVQNGASITGDQHSDRGIYIAYFVRQG